ncbi:YcxB family protein [Terrimonas ferruginea]|uniref:YcxB family protein n=1 Tax=Terrimonas ferruginea TaxID=249 RepID=UPI00041A10AC|nr:YcxB family protein [Terrimonas ferruginea]
MTIHFEYSKPQVIQALRYHFITRPEIRIMLILVNVFAAASILLYALGKVTAVAFLVSSFLWVMLMVSFWFIMPGLVYRRSETFQHAFSMRFEKDDFTLAHERGERSWPWSSLAEFKESPNFFHLYFDTRSFFLVPKSGCKDSDEVQELRHLLRDNIKK